jgi:hypothetical protein
MKLNDLIHKAAAGYPDARLLAYWDGRQAVPNPVGGDTLAEFIVRELCDTFDAKAGTAEQVAEAVRVLNRAKADLDAVIAQSSTAVENTKARPKTSRCCSRAGRPDHTVRQGRQGKPKTITVTMQGGLVADVEGIPLGLRVRVLDLDVEGMDKDDLVKLPGGKQAFENIWAADPVARKPREK